MKKIISMVITLMVTLGIVGGCFASDGEGRYAAEQSQKMVAENAAVQPAQSAQSKESVKIEPRTNYTEGLDARIADYKAKIAANTMTESDKTSLISDIKASANARPAGERPLMQYGLNVDDLNAIKAFDNWDMTDNTLRHLGHMAHLNW